MRNGTRTQKSIAASLIITAALASAIGAANALPGRNIDAPERPRVEARRFNPVRIAGSKSGGHVDRVGEPVSLSTKEPTLVLDTEKSIGSGGDTLGAAPTFKEVTILASMASSWKMLFMFLGF